MAKQINLESLLSSVTDSKEQARIVYDLLVAEEKVPRSLVEKTGRFYSDARDHYAAAVVHEKGGFAVQAKEFYGFAFEAASKDSNARASYVAGLAAKAEKYNEEVEWRLKVHDIDGAEAAAKKAGMKESAGSYYASIGRYEDAAKAAMGAGLKEKAQLYQHLSLKRGEFKQSKIDYLPSWLNRIFTK